MNNIEAVLFDLEGTIIDTEDMWAEATKQMLESRGIVYTATLKQEIHDLVHGLPPLQASARLKAHIGLQDAVIDLAQEKERRAYALMRDRVSFIAGFEAFFAQVKQKGLKVAIVTNSSTTFVQHIDQVLHLYQLFEHAIFTPEQVGNKTKPDPTLYVYAAQQLHTHPMDCLVIEDSAVGITAAVSAGMQCIGINTSGCVKNLLHAQRVVDNYSNAMYIL